MVKYLSYFFFFCILLLLLLTLPSHAQSNGQLKVLEVQEVSETGVQPQISPNGKYVLVRDAEEAGLTRIDMETGKRKLLVPERNLAGDVVFSDGGSMVVFSVVSLENQLRYFTIKAVDVKTGVVKTLDAPSRERFAFRFAGGKMKIAKRTTVRTQRLLTDIRVVEHEYVLATEDDDLVLYDGNIRKVLNPNGKNIYIWQSLSPDETKIAYVAINDGCHTFVCDVDGKNVVDLGHYIGAPTWLGNEWIVGQQDEDDGHRMTASRLVAIKPDGKDFQVLVTPEQKMPINPSASKDGKIVFENEGRIFLLKVGN
jgi:hypothetical protein